MLSSEQKTQNENLVQLKKDVEEIKTALKQKLPTLNSIGKLTDNRACISLRPSVKKLGASNLSISLGLDLQKTEDYWTVDNYSY